MKVSALCTAALLFVSLHSIANAQTGVPGDPKAGKFYYGLQGGVVLLEDADNKDTFGPVSGAPGTVLSFESKFDTGFAVGGFLGHKFTQGIRVEGELSYRRNGIDDFSVMGVSASSVGIGVDGHVDALSFMANGWYEPRFGKWLPYVGGGIGVARLTMDTSLSGSVPGFGFVAASFDESDVVFAWQAGAGIGYEIVPEVTLTFDYRFFTTQDPTFENSFDRVDTEYQSHNMMVGLRGNF